MTSSGLTVPIVERVKFPSGTPNGTNEAALSFESRGRGTFSPLQSEQEAVDRRSQYFTHSMRPDLRHVFVYHPVSSPLRLPRVQVCARFSLTRGSERPQSAVRKENRPRFTEVGRGLLASVALSQTEFFLDGRPCLIIIGYWRDLHIKNVVPVERPRVNRPQIVAFTNDHSFRAC